MKEPLVELRGIEKRFGDKRVLSGLDFQLGSGEVCAIIGPSGCGKSTLLRCINGLERPEAGLIRCREKLQIGMVFQRFHLFPHLNVLENLLLAPRVVRGEQNPEARARALLQKVGMEEHPHAWPEKLSGGQQQRVAIARCLMMEPELLLLDEPTSALDPELVGEVLWVIRSLAGEGRSMALVTHEMSFAKEVATRVVVMDQGKVLEEGSPGEVFGEPRQPRTRQFLQRVLQRN